MLCFQASLLSCHKYWQKRARKGNLQLQAFLNFRSFDFRNFRFNAVYNAILFSSPLVLVSNLDLRGFCFRVFFMYPHINSVNRGMPVLYIDHGLTIFNLIFFFYSCAHLSIYVHVKKIIANMDKMHLFFLYC